MRKSTEAVHVRLALTDTLSELRRRLNRACRSSSIFFDAELNEREKEMEGGRKRGGGERKKEREGEMRERERGREREMEGRREREKGI